MIRFSLPLAVLLASSTLADAQTPASPPKPAIELEVDTDFLALHLSGTVPEGTTALEYRVAEAGVISEQDAWTSATLSSAPPTSFRIDIPLKNSRWSALQIRALKGKEELARKKTGPDQDEFKLLTPERIAILPEVEHKRWTAYVSNSKARFESEFDVLAAECRSLGLPKVHPAPGSKAEFELDSDTPEAWFAGAEAMALAESVISYQTPTGGWSKAVDYKAGPREPGTHWTSSKGDPWHYCGTFDNRSTTEQLKLLAGVYSATKQEAIRVALQRGLDYLFEAQFPNGGWPQNYPLESGYHEAITLNDNAMIHILEVLLAIQEREPPFAFAEESLIQRAGAAFQRGIACLAAMQVKVDGVATVWCAQHDPLSLAPEHARTKEPPSLSGGESAGVVRFLMREAPITDTTKAMIASAISWFDRHKLTGLRKTKTAEGKTTYVEDAASEEVYWARFYDLKTGRAIFPGAKDGINYPTFAEMAAKNPVAYEFLSAKPGELLTKEMERWKKRLAKEDPAKAH